MRRGVIGAGRAGISVPAALVFRAIGGSALALCVSPAPSQNIHNVSAPTSSRNKQESRVVYA